MGSFLRFSRCLSTSANGLQGAVQPNLRVKAFSLQWTGSCMHGLYEHALHASIWLHQCLRLVSQLLAPYSTSIFCSQTWKLTDSAEFYILFLEALDYFYIGFDRFHWQNVNSASFQLIFMCLNWVHHNWKFPCFAYCYADVHFTMWELYGEKTNPRKAILVCPHRRRECLFRAHPLFKTLQQLHAFGKCHQDRSRLWYFSTFEVLSRTCFEGAESLDRFHLYSDRWVPLWRYLHCAVLPWRQRNLSEIWRK